MIEIIITLGWIVVIVLFGLCVCALFMLVFIIMADVMGDFIKVVERVSEWRKR